jgi:precorrin-2 dehydrogenase/sirohydrochlorin ferrochelatase
MLYPVFMKLGAVPCLVVGGGAVASRKVSGLLAASAAVTVLCPQVCGPLDALVRAGKITWLRRDFRRGDLEGFRLVIAATGSPRVNALVHEEAAARDILVNAVDDPEHSSFFVPATAGRGDLLIAVSTSGTVSYLARRLREHLQGKLYPGLERDLEQARAARARISGESPDPARRKELVERELEPLARKIISGMEGA